jgi:type IV secretory pathway VirB4 component
VGPTGSGKSFLLSSLMAPDERKANGPTVSTPGQHVPESGNVFVFDSNPIGEHRDCAGLFELS